ncbi:MAG: LpxI family protein [Pirellulaceae bacterium]
MVHEFTKTCGIGVPAESPVGLVAGWGRYPLVVAHELRRQGRRVVGLGIKDHADRELRSLCDAYQEVGLGKLGAAIRFFQRQGVRQATMAGKIHKVLLFQRFYMWKHFPDWRCCRVFFPHFISHTQDRRDDTLLGAVVAAFAEDGICFAPATDFVPELLVKSGILAQRRPTSNEWKDIEFGWRVAKDIGRLDIGQSVAVKGQSVLAVEAVEGTDRCIQRAGELCPIGGFVVVKVAKPQQDMRFDVPTIGMGTLETLVAAGGRVLAIEADKTILIDDAAVTDFANQHGVSLVAVAPGDWNEELAAA